MPRSIWLLPQGLSSRFLGKIPDALIKKSVLATREMVEATLPQPKPKKKRRAPRKPFAQ